MRKNPDFHYEQEHENSLLVMGVPTDLLNKVKDLEIPHDKVASMFTTLKGVEFRTQIEGAWNEKFPSSDDSVPSTDGGDGG